jgi:hypothetical protein
MMVPKFSRELLRARELRKVFSGTPAVVWSEKKSNVIRERTRRLQKMRVAVVCLLSLLSVTAVSCSPSSTTATSISQGKSLITKKAPKQVSVEDLGFSSQPPPGVDMKLHRMGAGEFDESGWCRATSTEGGFSVSLPNVFNDFTMTTKTADGVEVKVFAVGTLDARSVKFSAIGTKSPVWKFKSNPLEEYAADFANKGVLKGKRVITQGKTKGLEMRCATPASSAFLRLFKAPDTLYQLIVEAPNSIPLSENDYEVKRFFNSFTISEDVTQ